MPSSKNTPQALNKSTDERLLKPNEMSDAKNVTISTDSDGNGFVVKNAKGNAVIAAASGSQITQDGGYEVLGSCVDEEDNTMYFAVYDTTSINHGIYRIDFNATTLEYKKVLVTRHLFGTKPEFVDMDIIRADVNQAGTIVPLIYMTDNVTEPKKINVNRALSLTYNDVSDEADILEFLSVAKTKPIHDFSVIGRKDLNFDGNFIYGKNLSFAIQWVYKDGERSALSNISECTVPVTVLTHEEDGYRKNDVNFYEVSVDKGTQEVKQINVYYRDNETGAIYLADRLERNTDLKRTVGSTETTIYSATFSTYRFYGDRDQEPIALIEANKLFDNVPLMAKTQCIADGRLVYGNYVEGRELPDVTADFEAVYNAPYNDNHLVVTHTKDVEAISGFTEFTNVTQNQSGINIDFSRLPDPVPAGTTINVDFSFSSTDKPTFITTADNSHWLFKFDHNSSTYHLGRKTGAGDFYPALFRSMPDIRFTTSRYVANATSKSSVLTLIKNDLAALRPVVEYSNDNTNISSTAVKDSGSGTNTLSVRVHQAELTFKAETVVSGDSVIAELLFHDAVDSSIVIKTVGGTDVSNEEAQAGADSGGNRGFSGVRSSTSGDGHDIQDKGIAIIDANLSSFKSFKRGANHTFGIIFYDKKGRSSFVKELGSIYVKQKGESDDANGKVDIKVKFPQVNGANQTLPAWVDKYQIVYGGSDIDTFKQYSVSGGFANYWSYGNYDSADAKEDASKNLYISLKGWSGSKSSYCGENGANYVCNPADGDVLRVIHFDENDTVGEFQRFFPNKLEFPVVGKTVLRKDTVTDDINLIRAELDFENKREEAKERRRDRRRKRREEKGKEGPGFLTKLGSAIDRGVQKVGDKIGDNPDLPFLDQLIRTKDERKQETLDREEDAVDRLKETPISARNPVFPGGVTEYAADGVTVTTDKKDFPMAKGDFLLIKDTNVGGWDRASAKQVKFNASQKIEETTNASDGTKKHWFPILNWARNAVVEVYTPAKSKSERTYNELPSIHTYGTNLPTAGHVISSGDVWYKRVPVKLNAKESDSTNRAVDHYFRYWSIDQMFFKNMYLESEEASHFFSSDAKMFGRSHFTNKYAAENHRRHAITYSDKYSSDSPFLNLSNFNLSKANYIDLDSAYGGIDRLFSNDGYLSCIQSGKASRLPLGAVNVKLSSTTDVLTSADNVIGSPSYYAGRYGTRGKTQLSVMKDGRIYFTDLISKKVLQLAGDGITAISDIGMDSFFQEKIEAWDKLTTKSRVFMGYDPDYGEVLVAMNSISTFVGFVGAYNVASKRWTSLYEFSNGSGAEPTLFEYIGNRFISCLYTSIPGGTEEFLFHEHKEDVTRARYYGDQKTAVVETVVNPNPSLSKVFNAVSYEGNSGTWDAVVTTSDQNTDITSWEERERSYFALMPRDKSSNSTSHKIGIPAVVDGATGNNGIVINFASKVGRLGLPIGCNLYNSTQDKYVTTDGEPGGTKVTLKGAAGKVITINETFTTAGVVADGDLLYAILDQSTYGDAIRDYFCKIKLSSNAASDLELYAINTHYDRSNLGPELTKK
jgi:hypothetical protein